VCISLGNEKLLEYYFILTKVSKQKFKSKSLFVTLKINQGLNFKNVGRKLDIQLIFLTIICIPKS